MENKICILIPTRKRLVDFKIFADSWIRTTEGKSVVVVAIDDDDNTYDEIINNNVYPFIYERQPSKPLLHLVNDMAIRYAEKYSTLAFLEDDATFNTQGWESRIIEKQSEIGRNSIIWCNDLLNHKRLVGIPFMNSNIIKVLGYMSNPKFHTQYADNYWLELGQRLNSLYYFPDIVIEHKHYITGKRKADETSVRVNQTGAKAGEGAYYYSQAYKNDLNRDVEKLGIANIPLDGTWNIKL